MNNEQRFKMIMDVLDHLGNRLADEGVASVMHDLSRRNPWVCTVNPKYLAVLCLYHKQQGETPAPFPAGTGDTLGGEVAGLLAPLADTVLADMDDLSGVGAMSGADWFELLFPPGGIADDYTVDFESAARH